MNFRVIRPKYGTTVVENADTRIQFTRNHIVFNDQRDGCPLIAFLAEDVARIEREIDGS